jgi:hypothetical protein
MRRGLWPGGLPEALTRPGAAVDHANTAAERFGVGGRGQVADRARWVAVGHSDRSGEFVPVEGPERWSGPGSRSTYSRITTRALSKTSEPQRLPGSADPMGGAAFPLRPAATNAKRPQPRKQSQRSESSVARKGPSAKPCETLTQVARRPTAVSCHTLEPPPLPALRVHSSARACSPSSRKHAAPPK